MTDDIEVWTDEALKLMARNPEYWLPKIPESERPYFELLVDFVREMDERGEPYTILVKKES